MTKLELMTEMMSASHKLSIGLTGIVYELLPKKDRYKIEVLLETYTDALGSLKMDIDKGKEE